MPVKIRLARHGRKARAYYYIVVADSRAPRDGKFIERIGDYNPNTNPATINLDFDKALDWLLKGAQPTDTARAILSYEGVLYKKHLMGGVKKGAFDEAEMEKRFKAWKEDKLARIQAKVDRLRNESDAEKAARLKLEKEISDKRAQEIAAKNAEAVAEETTSEEGATEETEAPAEEASEEKSE